MNIDTLQESLHRLDQKIKNAKSEVKREKKQYKAAKRFLKAVLAAQAIIQHEAKECQQKAQQSIIAIVNRCLGDVFGHRYSFAIFTKTARGSTQARCVFTKYDHEINPIEEAGGGVVDVASFGLRLAAILLSIGTRRIAILDEPFRFVSSEYQPVLADLVNEIAKELKMQFILVTHDDNLKLGKVVRLNEPTRKGGDKRQTNRSRVKKPKRP